MKMFLKIDHVSKNYNSHSVLQNCSYVFDKGGIYVLTGQNGSGKSTLLRMCALLEKPDNGTVDYFSGTDVLTKDIALMRRITLVLPKIGIFNSSVYKNAAYGLNIRGIKGKEAENKINEVLDFAGLLRKKNQNALTLSSGETQRLGIARALAIEPEILFLDEPTASIDEENTKIVEAIIIRLKNKKTTMILTTHDKLQAERLADYLLMIEKGKLNILQ
jgi:tungstate transport system ATP-binding protein